MKVIGLTGFAKSGKSTAAEILKQMGGQEVAFAKHLKDVCAVVFDINRRHFDDQSFKEVRFAQPVVLWPKNVCDILDYFEVAKRFYPEAMLKHKMVKLTSPRHVAQYVGTELLRSIDENIHIKMAFKLNEGKKDGFLVCSDVRFENELKAVKDAQGVVFGISREAAQPADLVNLHPSEKEIPDLIKLSTIVVRNESSIEDFQSSIKHWANQYLRA